MQCPARLSPFFDSLLVINDIKTRTDHKTGGMTSNFWEEIADDTLNGAEEDDATAFNVFLNKEDPHYDEVMEVDLTDYDCTTEGVCKKKFNLLLKMKNSRQEHDNQW